MSEDKGTEPTFPIVVMCTLGANHEGNETCKGVVDLACIHAEVVGGAPL